MTKMSISRLNKNEIREYKSDTFFNFMRTTFLQNITVSRYILMEGKLLEALIFLLNSYNHVTSYHRNVESKISLISSIDCRLKF